MHYDVEADFYALTTCNYRYGYCFLSERALGAKLPESPPPAVWRDAFDATGRTWLLHVTGGEPFVKPDFVAWCEALSERHWLSINTNLSRPQVLDFAERVDPARVHFILAGLHLAERLRHGAVGTFVRHAQRLQQRGFTLIASVIVTPALVPQYPRLAAAFARQGLPLAPKILRGRVDGRRYPDAYTPAEREAIAGWIDDAQAAYAPRLAALDEPPTVDVLADRRLLDGIPDYRGRLCAGGQRFVQIRPDGTVLRCHSHEVLGNVLHGTLRLAPVPRPCDTDYCPYFCEKYTAPRFTSVLPVRAAMPIGAEPGRGAFGNPGTFAGSSRRP